MTELKLLVMKWLELLSLPRHSFHQLAGKYVAHYFAADWSLRVTQVALSKVMKLEAQSSLVALSLPCSHLKRCSFEPPMYEPHAGRHCGSRPLLQSPPSRGTAQPRRPQAGGEIVVLLGQA